MSTKLPVLKSVFYTTNIPSTKKEVRFRSYTVKEEKILLTAAESKSTKEILMAIVQVIGNCLENRTFDMSQLSIYDITWLWVQLTSKSLNNMYTVDYYINDTETIEIEVNLNDVKVEYPDASIDPLFKIDDEVSIKFKEIDFEDAILLESTNYDITKAIRAGIDSIYDSENVYKFADYSDEEVIEFIDSLDSKTMKYFEKFIENVPKVIYRKTVKRKKGDVEVKLEGLGDFFQLR